MTAAALVESAANLLVLRHPESVQRVHTMIAELMGSKEGRPMALSGIQIYKLLPHTNCKECGYPTCLAFAMKLAAKQAELSACPYVSEESKAQLEAAAQPPIRLVSLKANGHEVKAGNEIVMFRHEKPFYNKPGIFVRLRDDQPLEPRSRA